MNGQEPKFQGLSNDMTEKQGMLQLRSDQIAEHVQLEYQERSPGDMQ